MPIERKKIFHNERPTVVKENKTNSEGNGTEDGGSGPKTVISIQAKKQENECAVNSNKNNNNSNSNYNNNGSRSKEIGKNDKERRGLVKSSDCYSSIVKSNSFQEGFQRDCGKLAGTMVRSKTSVDMKCDNGKSHATTVAVTAHGNGCENETSPRHRRSSKDTDGWETVISRSRRSIPNSFNVKGRKFDVNKRFYEPSPSTSLPTLVMVETNGENDAKEKQNLAFRTKMAETKCRNRNRNNSGSNNGNVNADSSDCRNGESTVPIANDENSTIGNPCRDYKLSKERPIISSMFATIQPKRRKSSGEKDYRKAKPAKENKGPGRKKGGKESNERRGTEDLLDEESLRKSKELYEKEISLQKEINDLQNDADLETDADSDSTEIDQEIVDLCNSGKVANSSERRALLEAKYSHILINMSWAEQCETLDKLEELLVRDPSGESLKSAKNFTSLKQFEELVTRAPGRALELHQKLSSPSRKRTSPDSTILQHKAKQAKAKQNREQLLHDKSAKIRELLNKIDEVKAMQAQLANERRKVLELKQKRAEENRNLHLKNIQEKAHDEAKKQKEIAFINELEAQNKRHDFYALCQEQEDRLQSILEERQRRLEEKAAKEAAVEERRKAIEAERQKKNEKLQEKMRKREERIDRELQEKERERIKIAREKARDREDRLLALQAAQIANAEELQKKIQQKQENSARRHEENIEQIRQKAIEIGTPRLTPYQINKLCTVCNVVIDSEVFLLSHLKGKSHQEAVKKYRERFEVGVRFSECSIITDAPADVLHQKKNREKERQKTLRKRCKKIRQRLLSRSEEHLKMIVSTANDRIKKIDSSRKGRILKTIKEIEKLINSQGNGVWPNNAVTMLERNLFEAIRILEKGNGDDQFVFREFDGFAMLSKIYNLALDVPKNMSPYLPLKCFVVTSNLFAAACHKNVENCLYVLLSNNILQLLDYLLNRLNLIMPNSDGRNGMVVYKADTVADVLMNVCSNTLSTITTLQLHDGDKNDQLNYDPQVVSAHLQDVVSYVVCTGIVDKLAVYCSSVHDNKSADSYFLLHCMELLTRLVETRCFRITDKEDCTQLMATLKATELVGAVSMLYAMLLHQDSMSNDSSSTVAVLPPDVINVIIATLRLFSKVGELNLKFFQNILGAEGISLQVRHIISYLLRYCAQNESCKDLLHQVIEFIGFFAIHHTDNQMILQSGSTPTVLQQLSSLPFAYFSNPSLVKILFPTLLACCVDNARNRALLDQEVSFQLLQDFRNSEDSRDIPLVKLLRAN